jgi:hypothetical protein
MQLFLGTPIQSTWKEDLNNSSLFPIFVKNSDPNLYKISHQGQQYLGKPAGRITEVSSLDLLEQNIFGLLKKILPELQKELTPFFLLAIPEND